MALAIAGIACSGSDVVILATTTSTQDSGLLDVLVPMFEEESGFSVKTIAVGSGQAIRLGAEGEADVILAHSPAVEEEFVADGHSESRRDVMHNDFVIIGPAADPAGLRAASSAPEAFARIADEGSIFMSRGDESGTHSKELGMWAVPGSAPDRSWYQETGQGMGATLTVANEKRAYTLSDRGTFLATKDAYDLEIVFEGDPVLFNPYTVIVVSAERHGKVNAEGARAFAEFITSVEAQNVIRTFGVEEFGEPLFVPDATEWARVVLRVWSGLGP
jgi:tungstate transport system substrate-binding protein